ncbi:DUF2007 domain-containing protein [Polaribacter pacificus]|nr:DUF2007 domain-containing protein [Polaribacter pacificus]
MTLEHIKVFSDIRILATRLQSLLDDKGIPSMLKDNVESGRLGGFGTLQSSVDVLIYKKDLEQAQSIIENFQKEISE